MINFNDPLSQEQAEAIASRIAEKAVGLGLAIPAILFLEMHRPLGRLASQALVVGSPVLAPVFGIDGVGNFSRLIYHPEGIELLVSKIEEYQQMRVEKQA